MAIKKYSREIKVGILTVLAVFILYFGFNFLKGVNIFSPTHTYYAVYSDVNGLTEQAPVYIRGYKVGQVDKIHYDFTKEQAFTVAFSIDRHVQVPQTSNCALISDGLLGGTALQIDIPIGETAEDGSLFASGDTLPTTVEGGLIEELQNGLLADLSATVLHVDSLVGQVSEQLEGDYLRDILVQADKVARDLTVTSAELKRMMKGDVPSLLSDAKDAVDNLNVFSDNLKEVDIASTVQQVDSVVAELNTLVQTANSERGTVGMLLNDKELYVALAQTVVSADSLLTDLKANPKRYVHFSLFGKKDKK